MAAASASREGGVQLAGDRDVVQYGKPRYLKV
jgi:hypothetical protein